MTLAEFGDPRLPQKFWDKVSPEPNSGCWLWTASGDQHGYGRFGVPKEYRTVLSHRFSYEKLVGCAENLFVCHKCDNPFCVNPHHLFIGTQDDNMQDMSKKGRHKLNNNPLNNKEKTHCLNGHEFNEKNTRLWKGHRICRICHAERVKTSVKKKENNYE